eukprot:COSAG06_NODE_1950_length_7997_cov_37.784882_8_plen_178_part_00
MQATRCTSKALRRSSTALPSLPISSACQPSQAPPTVRIQDPPFLPFFFSRHCLSRACLGKSSFLFLELSKTTHGKPCDHCCCCRCPRVAEQAVGESRRPLCRLLVRKTASFFEVSLCLSRACLGKMIVFIYKWLKKAVFRRQLHFPTVQEAFPDALTPDISWQDFHAGEKCSLNANF